jgi:hypothetical protein
MYEIEPWMLPTPVMVRTKEHDFDLGRDVWTNTIRRCELQQRTAQTLAEDFSVTGTRTVTEGFFGSPEPGLLPADQAPEPGAIYRPAREGDLIVEDPVVVGDPTTFEGVTGSRVLVIEGEADNVNGENTDYILTAVRKA